MTANQIKQYDFTEAEVVKLFAMQDQLNTYIHPEWKTQGFNWGLAIVDECMEIHGHLGWKWWKKDYQVGLTEENRKQIQLEVIDILHFAVSQECEWGLQGILINGAVDLADYSFVDTVGFMLSRCTDPEEGPSLHQWAVMAHAIGLTKTQILETYTQKYVLNKFRQDHGYKTGEYCKDWKLPIAVIPSDLPTGLVYTSGEDNFWLEYTVGQLRQGNHDTTDETLLYSELERLYNSRLNEA